MVDDALCVRGCWGNNDYEASEGWGLAGRSRIRASPLTARAQPPCRSSSLLPGQPQCGQPATASCLCCSPLLPWWTEAVTQNKPSLPDTVSVAYFVLTMSNRLSCLILRDFYPERTKMWAEGEEYKIQSHKTFKQNHISGSKTKLSTSQRCLPLEQESLLPLWFM